MPDSCFNLHFFQFLSGNLFLHALNSFIHSTSHSVLYPTLQFITLLFLFLLIHFPSPSLTSSYYTPLPLDLHSLSYLFLLTSPELLLFSITLLSLLLSLPSPSLFFHSIPSSLSSFQLVSSEQCGGRGKGGKVSSHYLQSIKQLLPPFALQLPFHSYFS